MMIDCEIDNRKAVLLDFIEAFDILDQSAAGKNVCVMDLHPMLCG
jgi:hypothetical protein